MKVTEENVLHALGSGRAAQARNHMFLLDMLRITSEELSKKLYERFENWSTLLAWALRQRDPMLFKKAWSARECDAADIEAAFQYMNPDYLAYIEQRPLSDELQKALADALERVKQLKSGRISSLAELEAALETHDLADIMANIVHGTPLNAQKEAKLSPEELEILHGMRSVCPPGKKVACTSVHKKADAPAPKPETPPEVTP
jgi:hypothetical protein